MSSLSTDLKNSEVKNEKSMQAAELTQSEMTQHGVQSLFPSLTSDLGTEEHYVSPENEMALSMSGGGNPVYSPLFMQMLDQDKSESHSGQLSSDYGITKSKGLFFCSCLII